MRFINLFASYNENCVISTARLLKLLSVSVTNTTLRNNLLEHPDYPSLLGISDVLTGFGVENITIKSDVGKIDELHLPILVQLKEKQGEQDVFTVVKKINKENIISFSSEKNRWISLTKEEFASRWTGIAMLSEVSEGAGEKDFFQKRREEKMQNMGNLLTLIFLPFIASIAAIFAFSRDGVSSIPSIIFLVITLCGCFTGILLLLYEIDQHNPMLQQICGAGKKTNCNAILHSKAAKILGISWSSIGFSYFIGGVLSLLFFGITNFQILFLLAWINSAALPYTLFSIYYQWKIAKQWCTLCLTIQLLLVLQFITALLGGWYQAFAFASLQPSAIIAIVPIFLLPLLITGTFLPVFRKAKESSNNKTAVQRLKHNPEIFYALLVKQKAVIEPPLGLGITLGNPNASHKIIKVCNPYCGPCAKAHRPIDELLHNNTDLQVQIIFIGANEEQDVKTQPVKHLLAIAEKENETMVKQALDDWYLGQKGYEIFAAKYPMNGELQKQGEKVEAMRQWCNKAKIQFTPTFFVMLTTPDGESYYQLPETYSVSDLKYFLST